MRNRARAGLTLALFAALPMTADPAAGPGLGEALSAAAVEAVDLTVMPDGSGLPPGRGDARSGAQVYARHCSACHGTDGTGGANDALVGGIGTLAGKAPQKTIGSYWPYATTVFDYIRRAMPYPRPGTLSSDEVYAVTAYLLNRNGIIGADAVMTDRTLPDVEMPNQGGFRIADTLTDTGTFP